MRLKNVSIKGFKSFADQTSLHFGEDVTGIVGPNGSGKSNIVDAIRWVLGEMKNRELRLEKLNDVIFNGTQKRKRSGAAKVSLTFENTKNLIPTEYHSVTISRMLYQNGDSEYRLNDVVCRRKDIIDLFVDTGIGSNSYAIIGQGNISQVVEGHEGSRRLMIEQAAGISKYKSRKKEATQKLSATDADLSRVEDLLFELERSLNDLEKQARRARKYKEVKASYKEKSLDLAVVSSGKYRQEYQMLKDSITQEKEYITKIRSELHVSEAAIEQLKKRNIDLEQSVSSFQKEMNALLDQLRRMESAKEVKKQRLGFLREDHQRLVRQIKEARAKLEGNRTELEEADKQRRELQGLKEEKEVMAEKAKQNYDNLKSLHETARADLSEFLQHKQNLGSSVFNLEKGIAVNKNKIDGHIFTSEKVTGLIQDGQNEYENLHQSVRQYVKEKDALSAEIQELTRSQEERNEQLKALDTALTDVQKLLAVLQRELDKKSNERDLLQNMVDNLEGFPESVRFLSAQWKADYVLFSDIIDCPSDYRTALEAYLDPYLNYFVVQSYADALKALTMLNHSQKGKAQFFILEELDDFSGATTEVPEGCVRAVDIIRPVDPYTPILKRLLDKVFITESQEVLGQYSGSGTLLHKDGSAIRKRAMLRGGSVGLFQGKRLGRKKELERLNKEVLRLKKELSGKEMEKGDLLVKLSRIKEKNLSVVLKEKEQLLNHVNENFLTSSTRLEGIAINVARNKSQKTELEAEILTLSQENNVLSLRLIEEKKNLQGLEGEIESRGGEVDQWIGKISLAAETLNAANKELMLSESTERGLLQKIDFLNTQYKDNEKTVVEGGRRVQDEEEEQRNLEKELFELEEKLAAEYKNKGVTQGTLNETERLYYEERKIILAKEDETKELNRRLRVHQESLERQTQRYSEVRLEIRSIVDRVEVEFGVTLKEIMDSGKEVMESFEVLTQEVDRLRKRLENFGEINPMALEAFEEMKLRYDSIVAQRLDIFEAKESLEATIREIEQQATARFFDAFEKVKINFKEVFRTLFTEDDDCDLILTDPDDPLNSDVEVIARPKGKRPRILTQLSGGEKAMTAIALLFALYLLKPAPFCIFDEVDAPFDDMNVSKFNAIMRKFAEQSQFIVITHNKLTMAKVDVLYGIFMQEPGVSNVSQVDFRSFKDELVFESN